MKRLFPLLLMCLLLCGCTRDASRIPPTCIQDIPTFPPETTPDASTQSPLSPGISTQFPLYLGQVQAIFSLDNQLLALSGGDCTTLTVLSCDTLTQLSSLTLDFSLEPQDPSLVFFPGGFSFFDPIRQETLLFDTALRQTSRIAAPTDLTGKPILSSDCQTLFYCTADSLRAWDLGSGIRRCLREMSFSSQTLTGVHFGGTLLQCLVEEDGARKTRFFSGETGQEISGFNGEITLISEENRYYATVSAGTYQVPVFGTQQALPQMLIPTDLSSVCFFLPRQNAAVAASTDPDGALLLEYYDLLTGHRRASITLPDFQTPKSAVICQDSTVDLLFSHPETDHDFLLRWDISDTSPTLLLDYNCYTQPYYSASAPDSQGLSRCQAYADSIARRYGIEILLGKDAVECPPWDYTLEPEHLVSILWRELELLDNRLSQFPDSMISDTASHFSSFKIALVRQIHGNSDSGSLSTATGVQYLSGTDAYVVLAVGTYSRQALYHELFHAMETHIFAKSTAFDQWDSLNPSGFSYDYDYLSNASRNSGVYFSEENRAFIDTFSMSYPKEDRARIMEYAILPGNQTLFDYPILQAKLTTLCQGIREAYGLKKSATVYPWEQYLKKSLAYAP